MKLTREDISRQISILREKCQDESFGMNVYPVLNSRGDWIEENGELRNSKADYFSICAIRCADGKRRLKLIQKEPALVLLLIARVNDNVFLLLNFRSEPGLIGRTCLTTTIQSTPSNYLRKHGGKETPYVSYANGDTRSGKVIYDELQYDWLDFYLFKNKRYLIREIETMPVANHGYEWVDLKIAEQTLFEDQLISSDLRTLLLIYLNLQELQPKVGTQIIKQSTTSETNRTSCGERIAIEELRNTESHFDSTQYRDDMGTGIIFVNTESKSREVKEWIQPLLKPSPPVIKCPLIYCRDVSGTSKFAVTRKNLLNSMRSEIFDIYEIKDLELKGILGDKNSTIKNRIKVRNSAEGGRFYNVFVEIELIEVDPISMVIKDSDVNWLSEEELRRNINTSLKTSLELRTAFSLYSFNKSLRK